MKIKANDPKLQGVQVSKDGGAILSRAYAVLDVREIQPDPDGKFVTISGTASTPTPDRMGDVVDPMGAQFKTPMPLLWQHNSDQPVGRVTFAKPTKKGIPFIAQLPIVAEAGNLKDRIDEAIQSMKYGLVTAVSIGFRSLQDGVEWIEATSSLLFKQWEWLELSLVTIPANADATIDVIKSLDTPFLPPPAGLEARLVEAHRKSLSPGGESVKLAADIGRNIAPPGKGNDMNLAEQIKQWQAKRLATAAEQSAMMQKSIETGETLDEDQAKAYDSLGLELKKIDAHLKRLEAMQADALANAEDLNPADVTNVQRGADLRSTQRGAGSVIGLAEKLQPGQAFARYCLVQAKAFALKVPADVMAKQMYPNMQKMAGMIRDASNFGGIKNIMKAAVAAGTTSDATWGAPLLEYTNFQGDFISYLRPQSILGKFGTNFMGVDIPALRPVPFNVHIKGQTSGGTGYWVGEGAPKPLTKFDFNDVYLGWHKVAGITVVTEEMLRFSQAGADMMVRDALRDAIVGTMDLSFIDPTFAGGAASPESITHGVTPIAASGTTATALRADLDALWAPWDGANIDAAGAVYIMDSTTARRISSMRTTLESSPEFAGMSARGGMLDGVPVIVSNYVPRSSAGGTIILVSAQDVFLADDGQVTIDTSAEASLQMDTAPTNSSATPTATQVVSMFQTDSVALRAERYVNWKKRRSVAVQLITGAHYGS